MGIRSSREFIRHRSFYSARGSEYWGEDDRITLLRLNDDFPYDIDIPVLSLFVPGIPNELSYAGSATLNRSVERAGILTPVQEGSPTASNLRINVIPSSSNVREETPSSLYQPKFIGIRSLRTPKHVRISVTREIIEYSAQNKS
jgi:hypothetical protein